MSINLNEMRALIENSDGGEGHGRDFEATLAHWIREVQTRVTAYWAKEFPNQKAPTISADGKGSKFVRIVSSRGPDNRSSYAFIDKSNGDILKPAGWKTPAKGARGNIYAADPLAGVGPFGAAYKNSGTIPF